MGIESMKLEKKRYIEVVRGHKWEQMWNEKRDGYDEFCASLRAMKENNHPALFNVSFMFLRDFGHLFGTVKQAFESVSTPYVLVTQHDLRLADRFVAADVQNVLEALYEGGAQYILLNRDVNSGSRTGRYFEMLPDKCLQAARFSLTACAGFSDQAHFVDATWYRREVIDQIRPEQQLTCMEHVLHERWKVDPEWRRTFLYGGPEDGPFVYDLVHGAQVVDSGGRLVGLRPMPDRAVPI